MKKLYILFVSSPFLLPFTQVKTVNSYENKTFLKENFNLKNNNSNLKEKFIVFANKYKKIPKYKNISLFNSKLNDNLKFNNVSSGGFLMFLIYQPIIHLF
ncbi:hypothetical protein JTY60_01715 [symbiont of Argiope bruennichi]|uniref:hypothetical protein n=1 Tax=symbiont of Argiope bruennichi TaxID=2810479 RepID=UPI003DA61CC7